VQSLLLYEAHPAQSFVLIPSTSYRTLHDFSRASLNYRHFGGARLKSVRQTLDEIKRLEILHVIPLRLHGAPFLMLQSFESASVKCYK
jgi:hypothetical protein